ncbi:MAG: MFS transporter [Candidatus Eremiobacteraeota bacterium]|nr:MFS transporter [Candidatus Eremiobacteraeota bacterium]MBV9646585.1 MFS transporter [Candidatus Eremiobacteraeota bacterium]
MFARRPCEESAVAVAPAPAHRINTATWALVAAVIGSSMSFIDGTAVNVALPVLQRELGASLADAQWVIEGYSLFLSALLLVGGSLGDLYGRRRVFGIGIGLFALSSVACGLAPNVVTLVAARCVQGVGAALAVPGSLALISASYSDAERGRAIGTWSGFSAMTAAIGPVLGGFLAQHLSWRAVFYINVPLAAVTLFVLTRAPESRDPSARRVDVAGASLATVALGLLVYGLIRVQGAAADAAGLATIVAGVVLLGLFVMVERRERDPMVRLDLFANRTFSVTNLYTLLLYAALGGSLFFVPFNLIFVQHYTPSAAGASLLPFIIIMFTLSRVSGGLVNRVGARLPLTVGAILAGFGFVAYALCGVGRSYWVSFFPATVILGFGGAMFVAPLTTTVMGAVETAHAGIASGINNAVSRAAGLIAIALLGIVLAANFDRRLPGDLQRAHASPAAVATVQAHRASVVSGDVPRDIKGAADRDAVRRALGAAYAGAFSAVMLSSAVLAWAAGGLAFFALPHDLRRKT